MPIILAEKHMTDRHTMYIAHNTSCIKQLELKLAKFTKDLLENPSHTMEWADSTFITAAELEVSCQVRNCLEGDVTGDSAITLEQMHSYLKDRLFNLARNINSQSTSVSKNFMQQCRVAALLNEVEYLGRLIGNA